MFMLATLRNKCGCKTSCLSYQWTNLFKLPPAIWTLRKLRQQRYILRNACDLATPTGETKPWRWWGCRITFTIIKQTSNQVTFGVEKILQITSKSKPSPTVYDGMLIVPIHNFLHTRKRDDIQFFSMSFSRCTRKMFIGRAGRGFEVMKSDWTIFL